MLFPTSAQDSPRGLPDANDLCLGLQSLSLTGWDRPWSTQDSDASAQSSTHSGGCQKMSRLGEGARGVASEDVHSNSCSVPLRIPPSTTWSFFARDGDAAGSECAGQMVARKGRHSFSTYPDRFPGVVSLHLGWPWERSPR